MSGSFASVIQRKISIDSICHSMTTIATGGFSTHNDSIGFFKNSNIEIIASIFIVLGSIPFISYLKFAQGNKKVFFQFFLFQDV